MLKNAVKMGFGIGLGLAVANILLQLANSGLILLLNH